jgi:putative phage-type endonuclease
MTIELKQGTPEWLEARRGKITGTGFAKVLSKRGNTRKDYMRQLVLERKTGVITESFKSEAMEWGNAIEPQAREYYESAMQEEVLEVGFIEHEGVDFKGYVGVSPDGLINGDGFIEIKCPDSKTHLDYIAKNKLPTKYKPQVQGILWVTKRNFCDFISFDPRVEKQPFWSIRIGRDAEYIANLASEVCKFIDEMINMKEEFKDVDPQLLIDVTQGGCSEDEWLQAKQMEIRGKVRHGVVCALIQHNGIEFSKLGKLDDIKNGINSIVEFIMTGK